MPPVSQSSTKFIERNRPPRVQIEYELFTDGATRKIELPFVMGVMADLSGKPAEALKPVAERSFLEFDMDNFNDRMKAIKPRAAFSVPDMLSGEEGRNLSVELTFESMDDFSPGAVARKIEPLRKLLDARTQLNNLTSYMDGRQQAEDFLEKLLGDPALMKSLMENPNPAAATPQEEPETTES
jgi:type VI secretion system protein ImpB